MSTTAPSPETTNLRRRTFRQLNWGRLLLATVLLVIFGVGMRIGVPIYKRRVAIHEIKRFNGSAEWLRNRRSPGWLFRRVGEERVQWFVDPDHVFFRQDLENLMQRGHLGAILQLADGPTINDASLKCVLGLPNLKRLDLAFSNVGDDGVKHVSRLRVLEDLNLKGSDVSDLSVFNLSQMHSLQRLNVEHTKITRSGSRALEAALPECEVQGPHKRELMRFESGNLEKD